MLLKKFFLILAGLVLISAAFFLIQPKSHGISRRGEWFAHRSGDHQPLVMAHQGGEGEWPSNTMIAFRNVVHAGADVLDTDMHMSKDGVLVLIHDDTIDRTTNGKGAIRDLTISQIKQMDAAYRFTTDKGGTFPLRGSGVAIPTVEELFHEFPDQRSGIEMKDNNAEVAHRFCDLIKKYRMQKNVLVSSFYQENMDAFRHDCPEVTTSATTNEVRRFLTLNLLHLWRFLSPDYDCFQVPLSLGPKQIVTSDFLSEARKLDLPILPWTINDEADMRRVIAMRVYAINTDYPSRLLRILTH